MLLLHGQRLARLVVDEGETTAAGVDFMTVPTVEPLAGRAATVVGEAETAETAETAV